MSGFINLEALQKERFLAERASVVRELAGPAEFCFIVSDWSDTLHEAIGRRAGSPSSRSWPGRRPFAS